MEKYRKVVKPKSTEEIAEDEIRVTAAGSVSAYVSRVAKVFTELEKPSVTIKATGGALTKAVTLAEVVKRRFKGLHQITSVGSLEVVDEYEPIEEGLDPVTDTRTLTVIEIKISKEPLDTSDKGYQAPIDEALVTDYDPDKVSKSRGRGKGKGKSKGCFTCGGDHLARDCPEKPAGGGPGGSGCFICGGDHFARECPEGDRKGKGKGKGRGKGKGQGKSSVSKDTLDKQLEEYMGPDAVKTMLDLELDTYFKDKKSLETPPEPAAAAGAAKTAPAAKAAA
mmetsp:Transcript_72371/g.201979  ORF Transcript_72371/g.201979 Transcript_72371/m.201979 type:complete len:280 (-) Transcript_72371:107-946(-)